MNNTRWPTATSDQIARLRQCLPAHRREFPTEQPLAELGLDSLDTVEFLCTVHAEFGVRLREEDFGPGQTLAGLLMAIVRRKEQP
jgi:acyl carrier protein